MAGGNYRTAYLDLGPSKGGFAGPPTIANVASSDLILNNAALFGCSSAFFCKTKVTGLSGNVVSLWNGEDDDSTTWSLGEARVTPNPPLPADDTYSNVIVLITPYAGLKTGFYWQVQPLGGAGKFSTYLTIKWYDALDTALDGNAEQIWFSCMVISPRRGHENSTYSLAGTWAKQALYGGVPSNTSFVHPV